MERPSFSHSPDSLLQIQDFLRDAETAGWLHDPDIEAFGHLTERSPGSLFNPECHRPLTAAFFGGTGVGKSSLLNRLAGQEIAQIGIERPTSREVSIFLHESVEFRQLPNELPIEAVRMARHANESNRQILWVDMPDIDSVNGANRSIVLNWLPHIDVVIYVVSPERYRDDNGWQLLKQYGGEHAWIFVINQWDRGDDAQYEDFKRLLIASGFDDPIVLRTIAKRDSGTSSCELAVLESTLAEISSQHLMAQLEAHAGIARLDALKDKLKAVADDIGASEDFKSLIPRWQKIWVEAVNDLTDGMEWTLIALVRMMTVRIGAPKRNAGTPEPTPSSDTTHSPVIWDDWAIGRTQDTLTHLWVDAAERGLPARPLKNNLSAFVETTGHQVVLRGQLKLRQSLALPGNAMQRTTMRIAGFLSILLPVCALGWASYEVVMGYYQSATHHLGYLGTDFAIHTLLLIALAWLGPWFVYTRLRPSVEASALKGLRSGVRQALEAGGESVIAALEATAIEHQGVIQRLRAIQGSIEHDSVTVNRDYAPLIRRMIAKKSNEQKLGA